MKLHDRMKLYERQSTVETFLPKLPIMVRLDGKNFSSFTKSLKKPYDERLSLLMIETAKYLAELTNSKISYTQSDEISLVLYSNNIDSETYLNRRKFKIESILASKCSVYFNSRLREIIPEKVEELPVFDCRAWTVPTLEEAVNVFLWRERDCTKNAITMATMAYYSHNEIEGKNGSEKQEMLMGKDINFNDYPTFFKRGTYIQKRVIDRKLTIDEFNQLPEKHHARQNPDLVVTRNVVSIIDMPIFEKVINKTDVVFEGAEPLTNTI